MKRALLVAIAYLAVLALSAVLAFYGVLILAGPHGGLLPHSAQPLVLAAGWFAVLVLPAWVALLTWRRLRR
jgi:hypothetical protein